MKRKLLEWEEVTANEVTDKGLIFKMYKKLMHLNIRKKKLKRDRRPKQTVLQR